MYWGLAGSLVLRGQEYRWHKGSLGAPKGVGDH